MKPIDRQLFRHSSPIHERQPRFVLGRLLDRADQLLGQPRSELVGPGAIGRWVCDLARNSLTWSDEVYDIFGLPCGDRISRDEAVAHYCEHSRAVMEGLRADAIRRKQGFVVDVEIRPGHGKRRWMRLIGVPDCDNGVVMRLRGVKQLL